MQLRQVSYCLARNRYSEMLERLLLPFIVVIIIIIIYCNFEMGVGFSHSSVILTKMGEGRIRKTSMKRRPGTPGWCSQLNV